MNSKILKFNFIICFFLSIFCGNPLWASDFPLILFNMSTQASANSSQCTGCRKYFSEGYCAPACCESCQSENPGSQGHEACSSICSMTYDPTDADRKFADRCINSNFLSPGCDGMNRVLSDQQTSTHSRSIERRNASCNESVAFTKKYCTTNELNSAYPQDLFNLAEQIMSAPSCDLGSADRFNVRAQALSPQDVVRRCEEHFNSCKVFCFDQNTLPAGIDGRTQTYTNEEGQRLFESDCRPRFEDFKTEKDMRELLIEEASEKVISCQTARAVTDPETADEEIIPRATDPARSAINNPQVALNGLNQIASAIQPFIPANTGNYNPGLYNSEVASDSFSQGRKNEMTYEELYGSQPYEGSTAGQANNLDYIDDTEFNKPQGLANPGNGNPQTQQNGAQGVGVGIGSFGGGSGSGRGSNSGPNSKPATSAAKGRKGQKDKALYKMKTSTAGGSYDTLKDPTEYRMNRGSKGAFGGNQKLSSPTFNASKYHAQIMASYDKGKDSRAQILAQRRAAGLGSESHEEKRTNGYTDWHSQYKIHPEYISLFMQTRICYFTKFRSKFRDSCEFKK